MEKIRKNLMDFKKSVSLWLLNKKTKDYGFIEMFSLLLVPLAINTFLFIHLSIV